ncbi:MAG: hypothetical protein MUO58_12610 [Anaerolineales bacterium]|nr:hypothetical protein [Anaerolineales bacterium]
MTSTSTEQIEVPRYPGVGLSVPGSAITGAVESPGVAYEVVGAEDQGDPLVLPELRVEVDQNEVGVASSPDFTPSLNLENTITLPCPRSTSLVGLGIIVYLKRLEK